jgi:hypothetical protein
MFSTEISSSLAREHALDLRSAARHARFGRRAFSSAQAGSTDDVTIRVASPADHDALERLAQLDSRPTPAGYVLVAEVGGELLAAVPVAGGESVADPFRPTAALTSLLFLRARQLRAGELEPARAAAHRSLVAVSTR